MKPNILFVDDAPNILNGIKRLLHVKKLGWQVVVVDSGKAALEKIEQQSFDAIITDMRMPNMSGAELLKEVRIRSPHSARFVLSGYSRVDGILSLARNAHQYIAKPCNEEALIIAIAQVLDINENLPHAGWRERISALQNLPCDPETFDRLVDMLDQSEVAEQDVVELIASDIAMTFGVQKLTNSSFFSIHTKTGLPVKEAVQIIGLDTLRRLVLEKDIFRPFKGSPTERERFRELSTSIDDLTERLGVLIKNDPDLGVDESCDIAKGGEQPSLFLLGTYCLGLWGFDVPGPKSLKEFIESNKARKDREAGNGSPQQHHRESA